MTTPDTSLDNAASRHARQLDELAVNRLLDALWRQYPQYPSTFGPCANQCGSGLAGRGSGPCRSCIEHELATHTGESHAKEYHAAIQRVRAAEDAIFHRTNPNPDGPIL
jgi:hypothetical protein